MKDIRILPDYPIRHLWEVPDCKHEQAGFQGWCSLVGYYHCPDCQSRFDPQEFQNDRRI